MRGRGRRRGREGGKKWRIRGENEKGREGKMRNISLTQVQVLAFPCTQKSQSLAHPLAFGSHMPFTPHCHTHHTHKVCT